MLSRGGSICFCGTILLSGRLVPQDRLKGMLWRLGVRTADSVGPRCDVVVTDCPDMVTPFEGVQKARDLGIPVIASRDFFGCLHYRLVSDGQQKLSGHLWTDLDGTYGP